MNYLHSVQYEDGKEQLAGEYKINYIMIERYYKSLYSEDHYEVQATLKQLLKDFLLSQKEEKSLETLTGKNLVKYANKMIKIEQGKNKSIMSWVNNVVMIITGVLLLMFTKSFLNLTLSSFYFSYVEVVIVFIYLILDFIKDKIVKNMLYHYKLIFATKILGGLLISLLNSYLIYLYNFKLNPEEIQFSISVPPVIVEALVVVFIIYGLILLLIHEDKNFARKMKLLEESEKEFTLQKIIQ